MKRTPLYGFAKIFLQWAIKLFIPYEARHADHMPKEGKVILCCNHAALSDPLRLAFTQHRQIFFMSKAELFQNKPLGLLLSALGAFPVQRGKGDKGAINRAGQLLEEGRALGVFIEGTRSKTGDFLPPKAGAVMLAHNSGAPILPCCITPKAGLMPRLFHRCYVSYGELLWPKDLGILEGSLSEYRAASQQIMQQIVQLREEDLKTLHS